jgi:flagellar biosynthesis repressor protein FlbT
MMANLVLELKAGELLVINGATIRFRNRVRVELLSRARFLFGKQIMASHEANTPARKIYLALQTAYVGPDEERDTALAELEPLVRQLRQESGSTSIQSTLDAILQYAFAGDYYEALKLGRHVIRSEDSESSGQPRSDG